MEELTGIVERITYLNEENGFCVLKIKIKKQPELVTVVGQVAFVNIGAFVELRGEWCFNSKYGRQFKISSCVEKIPATIAGIERYLGSGLIKGIGPVNAQRIVHQFGEKTIEIIEKSPEKLSRVEGIGAKRIAMITSAWQEQKEIKNVMLFLQEHAISAAYAVKIYKTYGNASISIVKENPYRLADDIWGIGFKIADQIAAKLGFAQNSAMRCRAGLLYVLNQLAGEGHCFALRAQLLQEAVAILAIEQILLEKALTEMLEEGVIIAEEEDKFYLPSFYYSEIGVAKRIGEILNTPLKLPLLNSEKIIVQVQKENKITYDRIQLQAIKKACLAKFMVLTGGPGTGKTTTTLAIIKVLEKLNAKILLAAPTGRAAKRLAETTGREARTIHRLLEYKPPNGYEKNVTNPLDCDVLIIDEMSMVDIILMYNLLKAVPNKAMVILVGDQDQLPSVGPGNVLRDIINSGIVPVVKLTRIFRQARGSRIVTNAHRINKGEFPCLKGGAQSDFFFIGEEEPTLLLTQIKELCAHRLPTYFKVNPVEDIQVLTPMQRGLIGVRNLNEILQEALNPAKPVVTSAGIKYKVNDKVMQIKNNYEKNVFNGDIGRIINLDQEEKRVLIRYEQQVVKYDFSELDEVVLAYAISIHKSQGSEFKIVVVPIVPQHFIMLQRNLLYTCVTRAKKGLVLLGTKKAIAMALKNNKVELRNTMLKERLQDKNN